MNIELSKKLNKIIFNMKKKENKLIEIIKNQELMIEEKKNKYNSLLIIKF